MQIEASAATRAASSPVSPIEDASTIHTVTDVIKDMKGCLVCMLGENLPTRQSCKWSRLKGQTMPNHMHVKVSQMPRAD